MGVAVKRLVLLMVLFTSLKVSAADDLSRRQLISFTPVMLGLEAAYEYRLADWVALHVPVSIGYLDGSWFGGLINKIDPIFSGLSGLGTIEANIVDVIGGLGLKFYFNGFDNPHSWYLRVYGSGGYLRWIGNGNVLSGATARVTLTAGHSWVWNSGFNFGIGLGATSAWFFLKDKTHWVPLPKFDINFGYAW